MAFLNPAAITVFLETHQLLAYFVLFAGSYLETVIGIGFFVYGELFFLPGAILAGANILNIYLVMLSLYLGGIFGDSTSYAIGRHFGMRLFKEGRRFFSLTNYEKGRTFFDKHGPKGIFFARLMGPFSWITPFLSGVYKVPYRTFLIYNIPGVIVGIGQFIVLGYFFGMSWQYILSFLSTYAEVAVVIIALLLFAYWMLKRNAPEMLAKISGWFKRLI